MTARKSQPWDGGPCHPACQEGVQGIAAGSARWAAVARQVWGRGGGKCPRAQATSGSRGSAGRAGGSSNISTLCPRHWPRHAAPDPGAEGGLGATTCIQTQKPSAPGGPDKHPCLQTRRSREQRKGLRGPAPACPGLRPARLHWDTAGSRAETAPCHEAATGGQQGPTAPGRGGGLGPWDGAGRACSPRQGSSSNDAAWGTGHSPPQTPKRTQRSRCLEPGLASGRGANPEPSPVLWEGAPCPPRSLLLLLFLACKAHVPGRRSRLGTSRPSRFHPTSCPLPFTPAKRRRGQSPRPGRPAPSASFAPSSLGAHRWGVGGFRLSAPSPQPVWSLGNIAFPGTRCAHAGPAAQSQCVPPTQPNATPATRCPAQQHPRATRLRPSGVCFGGTFHRSGVRSPGAHAPAQGLLQLLLSGAVGPQPF